MAELYRSNDITSPIGSSFFESVNKTLDAFDQYFLVICILCVYCFRFYY